MRILLTLLLSILQISVQQVAEPVFPCYDRSLIPTFYEQPQVPDGVTIDELNQRKALSVHDHACITGANKGGQNNNRVIKNFPNLTELRSQSNFLFGTTYWLNDFLHVGHVHYDMVLIQVLQSIKVDRIVIQRPICHGSLCSGIGVMDSFYKGYFAALLKAGGQPHVRGHHNHFCFSKRNFHPFINSKLKNSRLFQSIRSRCTCGGLAPRR